MAGVNNYAQIGTQVAGMAGEYISEADRKRWLEENQGSEVALQENVSVGGSALKGAAAGAAMGTVIGPWGTAAGAVIGGAAGGISATMQNKEIDQANTIATNQHEGDKLLYNSYDSRFDSNANNVPIMANGGQINGFNDNGLKEYVGGGTHEQNPNGGIPIDKDGNPAAQSNKPVSALVEEGEASIDDFVFSNRKKNPTTKNTFATDAKKIKSKYGLREDEDMSKESMKTELLGLMRFQESLDNIETANMEAAAAQQMPMQMPQEAPQMQPNAPSQEMQPQGPEQPQGVPMMARGGTVGPVKDNSNIMNPGYNPDFYGYNSLYDNGYSYDNSKMDILGGKPYTAEQLRRQNYVSNVDNKSAQLNIPIDRTMNGPNKPFIQQTNPGEWGLPEDINFSRPQEDDSGDLPVSTNQTTQKVSKDSNDPNKPDFSTDYKKEARMNQLPGLIGNSLAAAHQYMGANAENVDYDRLNPDLVDYTRQRTAAKRSNATSGAVSANIIGSNASSGGNAMTNLVASKVGLNQNLNDTLGQSYMSEQTQNVGIRNQADAGNVQISNREIDANIQERDAARSQRDAAVYRGADSFSSYLRDSSAEANQNEAMQMMGTENYKLEYFMGSNGRVRVNTDSLTGVKYAVDNNGKTIYQDPKTGQQMSDADYYKLREERQKQQREADAAAKNTSK